MSQDFNLYGIGLDASHVHDPNLLDDWDDIRLYNQARREKFIAAMANAIVTKTFVLDSISDAMKTVDDRIKAALIDASSLNSSSLSGFIKEEDLQKAVSELKSEIEEKGYITNSALETYATKDEVGTVEENLTTNFQNADSSVLDYADATFATKEEIVDFVANSEMESYVSGVIAGYTPTADIDASFVEVSDSISELQTKADDANASIALLTEDVSSANSNLAILTSVLEEATEKVESHDSSIQELADAIKSNSDSTLESITELTDNLEKTDASLATLEEKVKGLQSEHEQYDEDITSLQEENNLLSQSIDELNNSVAKKENVDASFVEVNDKLTELETEDASINLAIEDIKFQLETLTGSDSANSGVLSELKEMDASLASAIEKKADADELNNLAGRVQTNEEAIAELKPLKESVETLQSDLESVKSEYAKNSEVKELAEGVDSSFVSVNETISDLKKAIAEIQGDVEDSGSNSESSLAGLKSSVDASFAEVNEKFEALDETYVKNEDYNVKVKEIEDKLQVLDAERTSLTDSVEELDNRVDGIEVSVQSIGEDLISLKSDLYTKHELDDTYKEINNKFEKLEDEDARINKALEELKATAATKESVGYIEKSIEHLESDLSSNMSDLKGLYNNLLEMYTKQDSRVDEVSEKLIKAIGHIKNNQTAIEDLKSQIAGLADSGKFDEFEKSVNAKLESLEEKVKGLPTDSNISSLADNVKDLSSNVKELKDAVKENSDKFADYSTTEEIEQTLENYQEKGDYVEYSDANFDSQHPGRKCIVLKNHDNIVGANSEGTDNANLVMLSKWNVADFGSVRYPFNINAKDGRATLNDTSVLATVDDIVDALKEYTTSEAFAELQSKVENLTGSSEGSIEDLISNALADYAKSSDIEQKISDAVDALKGEGELPEGYETIIAIVEKLKAAEESVSGLEDHVEISDGSINSIIEKNQMLTQQINEINNTLENKQDAGDYVEFTTDETSRKHIILPNHVNLVGTLQDGTDGVNLAMLSQWDVADFGSKKVAMNLNALDGKVTINDNLVVATRNWVKNNTADIEEVNSLKTSVINHNNEIKELRELIAGLDSSSEDIDFTRLQALLSEYIKTSDAQELVENKVAEAVKMLKGSDDIDTDYDSLYEVGEALKALRETAADKDALKNLSDTVNELASKDVVEYSDANFDSQHPGRKCIVLKNHDNIVGANSEGTDNANLVMLSKWDVADFGSARYAFNINAKDGKATLNDSSVLATIDDINSILAGAGLDTDVTVEDKIKEALTDYVTNESVDKKLEEKVDVSTFDKLSDDVESIAEDVEDLQLDVESLKNKDVVEYVATPIENMPDRKAIVLKNHDNIVGAKTDGGNVNLVMVSKWDVADFGSTQVHFNINTSDNVTINDKEVVATETFVAGAVAPLTEKVEEITEFLGISEGESETPTIVDQIEEKIEEKAQEIESKLTETDKKVEENAKSIEENAQTIEELQAKDFVLWGTYPEDPERKAIVLKNHDSLTGTMLNGDGANLVMLSKWDVADFGSTKVHFNINSEDRPTVNDDNEIAYKSEVDTLQDAIDSLDERLDEYSNTQEVADMIETAIKDKVYGEDTDFAKLQKSVESLEENKAEVSVVEELAQKLEVAVNRIDELEKKIEEMNKLICIDKDVDPDEVENPEETDIFVKNDEFMESFKSENNPKTFQNITIAGTESSDALTFKAVDKVELENMTLLP